MPERFAPNPGALCCFCTCFFKLLMYLTIRDTYCHCSTWIFRQRTSKQHIGSAKKNTNTTTKKIVVGSRVTFFPNLSLNYWKLVEQHPANEIDDGYLLFPGNHPRIYPWKFGPPTRQRRANSWRSGRLHGGGKRKELVDFRFI